MNDELNDNTDYYAYAECPSDESLLSYLLKRIAGNINWGENDLVNVNRCTLTSRTISLRVPPGPLSPRIVSSRGLPMSLYSLYPVILKPMVIASIVTNATGKMPLISSNSLRRRSLYSFHQLVLFPGLLFSALANIGKCTQYVGTHTSSLKSFRSKAFSRGIYTR